MAIGVKIETKKKDGNPTKKEEAKKEIVIPKPETINVQNAANDKGVLMDVGKTPPEGKS